MAIIKLNLLNFSEKVLNNEGVVLVDFYADWCGPCKMLAPIIDEVAAENSDLTVGKVNVDEAPELAQRFGISSIPTLLVFKNGSLVSQNVGYCTKEAILGMISL